MTERDKIKNGICPACECSLSFQEGCMVCHSCGWAGCDG